MTSPTYYIDGLHRQANARYAREYLGIQDVEGHNLLYDFNDSTVTAGRFVQSLPGWNDVRIPMSGTSAALTNPAVLAELFPGSNIGTWRFSHLVTQSINFEVQMPHGINFNFPIDLHIHWSARTPATNVIWGVTYTTAALDGVFGAPATVWAPPDSTTQNFQHHVTDILSLPVLDESQVIHGILTRDSADGFNDFVYGLSFDAHYVASSLGSLNEEGD